MDKNIIKNLFCISKSVAKIYEKLMDDEDLNSTLEDLKVVLDYERKVYMQIPISQYEAYIKYIEEISFFDPDDVLEIMLEGQFLEPRVRILNYFSYLKEKYAMHSDEIEEDAPSLRQKYLMKKEYFHYLKLFYLLYLSGREDLFGLLYPSYLNVSYSFLYMEEYFLDRESVFSFYDKSLLEKFSGISNVSFAMDASFSRNIKTFYDDLFGAEEKNLFSKEDQISQVILYIYVLSLYFSLQTDEKMDSLLEKYNSNHYSHFSSKLQKFLDDIVYLVNTNKELIRNLKRKQEGLPHT